MFLEKLYLNLEFYKNNNAFCIKDEYFTYGTLKSRVSSIQKLLSNLENTTNFERIGIICTDDFSTYAAIIAIWFKGFSFVPLGLHNPVERNLKILQDANVSVIFSTIPLEEELYNDFRIVYINEYESLDSKLSKIILCKNFESSIAYVLFTSGSTGLPKGVPITFQNLEAFLVAFNSTPLKISEVDRCLQMFELTFDVSISSFVPALLNGACVYTVPNEVIKYIHVLKLIYKYNLTFIQIVPSIIKLAKPLLGKTVFKSVRFCILTGEATNVDLLPIWQKCIPSGVIYNFYGPTESTIYCSYYECKFEQIKSYNGMLAIGKPFENVDLVIVDDKLLNLGSNQKGELLIRGEQLTNGYLNNPEKNKTSFVNLVISGNDYTFYRSGDICFKDDDGDIFYCGRIDSQVKVNGFRIELTEIEVNVREFTRCNNTIIATQSKNDTVELILVIESENSIEENLLFTYLKSKLPNYMIPARIFSLPVFPLNSSGKTDKVQIKTMINAV